MTGLPPSPEEIAAFEQDSSADAYEQVVDRLLSSPRYGERWAQHWLDVVRYAETEGYEYDRHVPDAWRYRDYVIDSFNRDMPFDRFRRSSRSRATSSIQPIPSFRRPRFFIGSVRFVAMQAIPTLLSVATKC